MNQSQPLSILIACGGTGGHLFPGIAVAEELLSKGHQVRLLISEKKVDEKASKKYEHLDFVKIPAIAKPPTLSFKMFPFLGRLFKTIGTCKSLLKKHQVDVVLGMGGFTSFPPIVAGKKLGLRTYVHDSNAIPGRSNLMTSKHCSKVLLGLGEAKRYFPNAEVVITGTPVRKEMQNLPDRETAAAQFGLDPHRPIVLVVGGSQGARQLNTFVVEASEQLGGVVQWLHITGMFDFERVEELSKGLSHHQTLAFCDQMPAAYACTDLAVCRSGASSLTELSYLGIPSVLVPYPHAADDHQTKNAEVFEKGGAAIMASEAELSGEKLIDFVRSFINSYELRKEMSEKALAMASPQAASRIAEIVTEGEMLS